MSKLTNRVGAFNIKCSLLDESEAFYDKLFQGLGLEKKEKINNIISYWSNFGIILQQQDQFMVNVEHFYKLGVFQISINVSLKEVVDEIHTIMLESSYKIYWPPKEFSYAPGYYSTCIHDPDDNLIEIVFVPE